MTDSLALGLRVALSLAAVLLLMWVAARLLRGHGGGRSAGVVEVVARQQLGRGTSVAVVRVVDRALVLGVTETGVSLLSDADLAAVEAARTPVAAGAPAAPGAPAAAGAGALLRRGYQGTHRRANGAVPRPVPAVARDAAPVPPPVAADSPAGAAPLALAGPAGRAFAGSAGGPLAGSVLSPATWRAAVEALRERTVRRG